MKFISSNASIKTSAPLLVLRLLILLFLVKILFAAIIAPWARAEGESLISSSDATQRDPAYQYKLEQWKKLKESNPTEFQALVSRRKKEIRKHLETLEAQDPGQYENLKKDFLDKRREKVREMQRRNPEQFRQRVEGRLQRLQHIQEKNPERFNQFTERHPRLASRFQDQRLRPKQNLQDLKSELRTREGLPVDRERRRQVRRSEEGNVREPQGGVSPGPAKQDRKINGGPDQFNRPRREMKQVGERSKRQISRPGRKQRESRPGR